MAKYRGQFRIESARLVGWDYTAGWYFVTVCTHARRHAFGDVVDGVVRLSPIGDIVADEWRRTAVVRPNVTIDMWVVMPDHFHGIIAIHNDAVTDGNAPTVETPRRGVSTPPPERMRVDGVQTRPNAMSSRLRAGSLGAIVGQWKSAVTKRAHACGYTDFAWQTRFYDVIIRDQRALDAIRRYIAANPRRWPGR